MPRKHLVASQTNKKQQNNAKVWQKLAKEIKAAAKVGGPNIEANPRLKAAVDRALQFNLSRDSIERNINGSTKDSADMVEVEYEIYGPNGLGIIVHALTDNTNRTISNLNGHISKLHGKLAKPNSVKINFEQRGIILTNLNNYQDEKLLELLIDFDLIDLNSDGEGFEIVCSPNSYYEIKNVLSKNGFEISHSELKLDPLVEVSLSDNENEIFNRFLDACEDDDDIQWVVSNKAN
ncbi:YebC/PmpR family DNA-binding transcriptional regulator [[Mycoplasma] testudinis]|uniref:YebC/PmpR family DNA-binding transcriptional regulator n=1 Tax=[Mycoplasma] testudinis TaxID=33924 RepID=UPI00048A3E9D|nr:YebC/PmpR family DNA-binding transcriptional regulator [[Mycoplasma] testudinis]